MRLLATLFLLLPVGALAQVDRDASHLGELVHARNTGMGMGYRALGYGLEAISSNPAGLALYKRYQIELTGAGDAGLAWGFGSIAFADTASSELSLGFSYQFVSYGAPDSKRTAHLTNMAVALPLGELLALGLNVRHQGIIGGKGTNSVTLGAGLVIRPTSWLMLQASGQNLIDNFHPDIRRVFAFGLGMNFGFLTPAFDFTADFNDPDAFRYTFGGGLEFIAGGMVPLRAGYQYDTFTKTHFLGGGIGLFQDGSGIDVSYRHELGGDTRLLTITLKLQQGG